MQNEHELTPSSRTIEVYAARNTSQREVDPTLFFRQHPIASLTAAAALGFVLARLFVSGDRSSRIVSPRRRLLAADAVGSTRAWPTGDRPKAHGDKLANAAREAATRTRAPTYPEG
ncbi:MAG: hypothetical protein Q8M31_19855 [Beijerinckiaceae bacterium]|nr:hypothetical protein [Beijerinckiaceae bacterium]